MVDPPGSADVENGIDSAPASGTPNSPPALAKASGGAPELDALRRPRPRDLRRFPRLLWDALVLSWRAARNQLLIAGAIQLASAVAVAGQLLIARNALEAMLAFEQGAPMSDVVVPVIGLGVLTAVVAAARAALPDQQKMLAELTANYAMAQVLEVATTVDLVAFDVPGFHDRLQRAQVNAQTRPGQMAGGILGLLASGAGAIALAAGLLVLQPEVLLLVLVSFFPAWYAARLGSRAIYHFAVTHTDSDRRRTYLGSLLSGRDQAKEIRAFRLRHYFLDAYWRLSHQRLDDLRALTRRRLRWSVAGSVATSGLTAATFGVLLWSVSSGRTPLADAGASAAGVVLLGVRLQGISRSASSLYESSLFVEDFTSFVAAQDPYINTDSRVAAGAAAAPKPEPASVETAPELGRLVVREAWFQYPSGEKPCLRNVSMHVEPGETVALVGENGSGKTTLAKLIAGLYQPSQGNVSWGGIDTADLDRDRLSESIAVIFQDFVKYFLPARTNIEAGRIERRREAAEVEQAAKWAGAHDDLAGLPLGYETPLGPHFAGGTDLSIGQWQRVALARGFFRNAPFLILDEPTSALDPRGEARLFEHIRTLFEGRSVLLISHRFSSVRAADRIYVLDRGEVIEHGNHESLMAAAGRYAELFSLQAAAYQT